MAVYIDPPCTSPGQFNHWCHLFTDGDDQELLRFGRWIGLRPEWFQTKNRSFHHFDVKGTHYGTAGN